MTVFLRDDLASHWNTNNAFEQAASQQGDIFRAREGRRTLRFEQGGNSYFLKYHAGIGWKEVIKNLTQAKLPIISAMSEVRAIKAATKAGIDTMTIAGFGERGHNPAHTESFIVTDDLTDTLSLEDAAAIWKGQLDIISKRHLIIRLADITRRLHTAGINHRDYYLCHFLVKQHDFEAHNWDAPLYLIDLHRSQIRKQVPKRWLVKDLGGLYFSAASLGLSTTDIFRFISIYSGLPPSKAIKQNPKLWLRVKNEAERLYQRFYAIPTTYPLSYQPIDE